MTRHVEFLVEDYSLEVALDGFLGKIIPSSTYQIRSFRGKADLLSKLDGRLRGYSHWIQRDTLIVVILDLDAEDLRSRKAKLESVAASAGLVPKSSRKPRSDVQVLNILAVKELEAWFFGDWAAVRVKYPRLSSTLPARAAFRDPDAIHFTWEALEGQLQQAGYFKTGLLKVAFARAVSVNMDPQSNSSGSFKYFRDELELTVL